MKGGDFILCSGDFFLESPFHTISLLHISKLFSILLEGDSSRMRTRPHIFDMELPTFNEILGIDYNTIELAEAMANNEPWLISHFESSLSPLDEARALYQDIHNAFITVNNNKAALELQLSTLPEVLRGYISICELLIARKEG